MFSQSILSLEPGRLDLDSETAEVNELFEFSSSRSRRFIEDWDSGHTAVATYTTEILSTTEFCGPNIEAPHNRLHAGLTGPSWFALLSPSLEVTQHVFASNWQDSYSLNAGLEFSPLENFSPASKAMKSAPMLLPPSPEVTQNVFRYTWLGCHSLNDGLDFAPLENFSPTSKATENPTAPLPQTLAFNAPFPGVHSRGQHRNGNTSCSRNHASQCSHQTSSRAVLRDAIVKRLMTNATPRILDAIENEMMRLDPDSLNSGGTAGESKL